MSDPAPVPSEPTTEPTTPADDGLREVIAQAWVEWENADDIAVCGFTTELWRILEDRIREWLARSEVGPSPEQIEAAARAEYHYFSAEDEKEIPWEKLGQRIREKMLRGAELGLVAASSLRGTEETRG